MQLSGSVAIVTGGASGLGEATVREFSSQGASVAIFDMNADRGTNLAEELGSNVIFVPVNVVDEASVSAGIAQVIEKFGAISICINCAGIATAVKTVGRDGAHPLGDFSRTLDVNLKGTFNVLRLAAVEMTKNDANANGERGVIVNTASVAAFDGQKGQAAYAASKGGIAAMSLPVARDLAYNGIRCCAIAPGLFLTPMFESLGEEVCIELAKDVTFPKRLGKPAEFASLARVIVENVYLNGETIRLDGGIRLP
ncbi:MAG: SDR family NAD(P)-dependent oxidoreductase [Rhodobacteraceae bacterium]|nr:SDR family NAD(P)-dependent oxidoreductase [Paracoccaceae bacterium]